MFVLDTDHLSLLEMGENAGGKILRNRLDVAAMAVTTTIVTYEEQSRGWLAYVARAKSHGDQVHAYYKL